MSGQTGRDFAYASELDCPAGPLLLRGDHLVPGPDGALHRTTRPVSAVCQCDRSARRPWCDGTHKVLAQYRADPESTD